MLVLVLQVAHQCALWEAWNDGDNSWDENYAKDDQNGSYVEDKVDLSTSCSFNGFTSHPVPRVAPSVPPPVTPSSLSVATITP